MNLKNVNLNFFGEAPSLSSGVLSRLWHAMFKVVRIFISGTCWLYIMAGSIFDEEVLKATMQENLGSMTFIVAQPSRSFVGVVQDLGARLEHHGQLHNEL